MLYLDRNRQLGPPFTAKAARPEPAVVSGLDFVRSHPKQVLEIEHLLFRMTTLGLLRRRDAAAS